MLFTEKNVLSIWFIFFLKNLSKMIFVSNLLDSDIVTIVTCFSKSHWLPLVQADGPGAPSVIILYCTVHAMGAGSLGDLQTLYRLKALGPLESPSV